MCFRPPEASAGEFVCQGCYTVVKPNDDGTCPECGFKMGTPSPDMSSPGGAPSAPEAPGAPKAPPGAPPKAPGN